MPIRAKLSRLVEKTYDSIDRAAPGVAHDETVLQQSNVWMRAVTWALIGTTGFAVAWLSLAKTDEVVIAAGNLEPIGAVKEVQMPVGGIAKEILVKEGQLVRSGQVLVRLDADASRQKKLGIEQAIRLKSSELALKQREYAYAMRVNNAEATMLGNQLGLDREIAGRLNSLAQEGATGKLQALQQQNKVQETQGRLMQNRADRLRQASLLDQQMQQLRATLADLNSQLAEATMTLRYQEIRSPADGVVFDLKPKVAGYAAQGATTILKIVPQKTLEGRVEIASDDIGFVRTGMPVDVSIDSYPASDFGVLQGTVRQIASDALPPDPAANKDTYRYPAKINLSSQQLRNQGGPPLPLQAGMSIQANIKLRKVSYLQLLLGSFRDKADSLRRS